MCLLLAGALEQGQRESSQDGASREKEAHKGGGDEKAAVGARPGCRKLVRYAG